MVITKQDQLPLPPKLISPTKQQRIFQAAVKPVLSHLTPDIFAPRLQKLLPAFSNLAIPSLLILSPVKKVVKKVIKPVQKTALKAVKEQATKKSARKRVKIVVSALIHSPVKVPKMSQSGRIYKPTVRD